MATTEELERKVNRLENLLSEKTQDYERLAEKAETATDIAMHAYKVDHYAYIWVYDHELKKYRKTKMRVGTPEVPDKSITSRKIADRVIDWYHIIKKAIRNEHIADTAIDSRTLADNSVLTRNIADEAVTPEKLSDDVVPKVIDPLLVHLRRKDDDLQNQIDSFNAHGVSVSNEFGDDPHISVSQKTLTAAFSKVWSVLEDITGEVFQGISLLVTPEYYIGEDGCNVHITATSARASGIFEHIAFYLNGTLLTEADSVDFFEYDTEIHETTVVKVVAKVMGIEYTRQHIVTHYNSFWLGAGAAYSDIMDVEHVIPITNGMRGAYDIEVREGDHIIIVVGESLAGGFLRADMNSVEIQFTESTIAVDGNIYRVFTSENVYIAGTYNIDING